MPLSLPDVTLCAVTSINHELTVRAMNECLRHCSFADVVLIATQPVKADFRVEIIPPSSATNTRRSFAGSGKAYGVSVQSVCSI